MKELNKKQIQVKEFMKSQASKQKIIKDLLSEKERNFKGEEICNKCELLKNKGKYEYNNISKQIVYYCHDCLMEVYKLS